MPHLHQRNWIQRSSLVVQGSPINWLQWTQTSLTVTVCSCRYDHEHSLFTCYTSSGPPCPRTGCTPQVSLKFSKRRCRQNIWTRPSSATLTVQFLPMLHHCARTKAKLGRICRRSISNCCKLLCQQNLCSHLQTCIPVQARSTKIEPRNCTTNAGGFITCTKTPWDLW